MNAKVDISNTVLETSRLILRPWRKEDLNDFYEYCSVEGVGEMAGWPHHQSIVESKIILDMFIEEKKTFAVVYKENKKAIGSVGIEKYSEDAVDENTNELSCREIGYVLNKDYWGQGLMTEAVKEVIRYCFEEVKVDALFCGHFERNLKSKRVIEKCGFQFYRNTTYKTRYGTVESTKLNVMYREDYGK